MIGSSCRWPSEMSERFDTFSTFCILRCWKIRYFPIPLRYDGFVTQFKRIMLSEVNIIPIVLTNRVLAKCARARASRACAQMVSLRHGESKRESVRRPWTQTYRALLKHLLFYDIYLKKYFNWGEAGTKAESLRIRLTINN